MKPFAAFTASFSEEDLTALVKIADIGLQDNWNYLAITEKLGNEYLYELEGKINVFLNMTGNQDETSTNP